MSNRILLELSPNVVAGIKKAKHGDVVNANGDVVNTNGQVATDGSGPSDVTPALGIKGPFSDIWHFNFGRSDKGVDATIDSGIPSGHGPYRFVFSVGGQVALDANLSDYGDFIKVEKVGDFMGRYGEYDGQVWEPKPGYEDIVEKVGQRDPESYMVRAKGMREGTQLFPVPYDGRPTNLKIYSARGLEYDIDMNGAVPDEYFIIQLEQAGLHENLKYIFK